MLGVDLPVTEWPRPNSSAATPFSPMKTPTVAGVIRFALNIFVAAGPLAPVLVQGQAEEEELRDYSKTNSVILSLVDASRRDNRWVHGLSHAFWEKDGRTTLMDVAGVPCRNLSLSEEGRAKGYFYFALNPSFKEQDVTRVRIDVEYYDGFEGQAGVLGLQYDASASADGFGVSSKQMLPNVPLNGSGQWLKATFHIRDGTFQNAQNSRSDFRLVASPPELSVRRVTVTLEPEQGPAAESLKFDASGEAALGEWNIQWDAGDKPTFSRGTNAAGRLRWLQIALASKGSGGSWRRSVLLEPGRYQFVGRVIVEDPSEGIGQAGGARLRVSGGAGSPAVSQSKDWTMLNYEFTMTNREYVELVCELRELQGSARFDLGSLKIIRRHEGPP